MVLVTRIRAEFCPRYLSNIYYFHWRATDIAIYSRTFASSVRRMGAHAYAHDHEFTVYSMD